MRRYRLSSLLFVIAIAALGCALFFQQRRAAMREQQLLSELKAARAQVPRFITYVQPVPIRVQLEVPNAIRGKSVAPIQEAFAPPSADKASDQPADPDEP